MTTPASMAFSALISLTGLLFIFWHTWHYDRWRCLLYTKDNWFRAMMCHILILSVAGLQVYTWIDVHVLYSEYWIYYPPLEKTIVTPYQLYSKTHYNLFKTSLYFITVTWGFLQGVHLEEFLYWGYLIKSIYTPGGPQTSWLRSGFFKAWIGLFICSFALLIASVHIENTNLDMIRAYLFCVGSSLSILLAFASVGLCLIFPSFLTNVRRQGANAEVLERLHFFSEMNEIRTACRLVYSICFLIISADAFTAEQRVNKSRFWSDTLYLCGQLGLFCATCLSVVVLLPRNMTSESLPIGNQDAQPIVPYNRPPPEGYSAKQFMELGERLNIGDEAKAIGLITNPRGFEMQVSPPSDNHDDSSSGCSGRTKVDAPFAEVADKTKVARLSELPNLPSVVQKFKSPFETAEHKIKGPTQVFVTTSHMIVEE
ncbi:hypothetical protein AYX13_02391 [Cryptococcus neoformans]|nr:hypothetical protein AYX13_02391 [Cryptococcus neoformans var. grubii]